MAFSFPGERNGGSLHSCPGNPTDRGAWRAAAHGAAELDTPVGLRMTESSFIVQVNSPVPLSALGEADIVKNQACYSVCLGHGGKQKQAQVERRGRFPLSVVNSHGSVKIRENTQPTDFRMMTVMQFIISFSE